MNENTNKSQFPQGLPFTQIFKTFRLSIQPSKLFLSLFAIALICLTGWLMDLSKTVIVTNQNNNYKNQTKQQNITELDIYLSNPQNFESKISGIKENSNSQGLFKTLWRFARSKFNASLSSLFAFNFKDIAVHITEYLRAIEWALKYHLIYCLIFVLIKLSIIAVFGGAICRMSALQYAKNEKPGMFAALSFSLKRFTNFFAAPLIPIFLITVVGLLAIASFALTANIPLLGGFITAVFIPLIFLAGAFIAFLIIGAAAGFNLMFPAICYDGSDCFDAMSRSFSYIYAKPWTFGFYSALAA
ncbi:MAG: hypothetical protein H8D47_03970, partial [Planctomycetes bacterium]|nr:hypothetical protein [Planctomycetota bacterium]